MNQISCRIWFRHWNGLLCADVPLRNCSLIPAGYLATFHHSVLILVPVSQEIGWWNGITSLAYYFADQSRERIVSWLFSVPWIWTRTSRAQAQNSTQQSGCPSQTSSGLQTTESSLRRCSWLSSTGSVSYGPYVNIQYPVSGKIWFWLASRFNYSATIWFRSDRENLHSVHL